MRRILLILLALLPFAGCVHSKSLDEYAYVLNIGVEPGTTMPYLVTFLVSVPGGGTEEMKVTNTVLSAEARTFSEATETLNAAYPGRLSFSRASLLVLHEDLARTGAQTPFLDFSFGKPDLWQNLRVAVAKGSIREVFEGVISDADPSLRKIKTAVGELSRRSGLTADVGYGAYLEAVQDDRFDAMLAYAGVNEWTLSPDLVGGGAYPYVGGSLLVNSSLKTSTVGTAVFDGDRMVGILNGQHTMSVLMVTDAFRRGERIFALPDGRPLVVTLYRVRRPRIRLSGDMAQVKLFLEADVGEPQSVQMDSESFKALLRETLESDLSAVFMALQGVGSDAMGFGRFAAKEFRDAAAWEAYDWKAAYRTLRVAFSVSVGLAHDPRGLGLE